MALMNMDFPDDLLSSLLDTQFSEIAETALTKATPVVNSAVETSLRESADRGYATGTMVRSVKATKPKRTKTDAYIIVSRPTGVGRDGVRNMEKAMYLEYGTCKEASRPWLTRARNNAESEVLGITQDVYSKMVGAD